MSQQISNPQEFEDNLKKLSDLYEEAKDLTTFILPVDATDKDMMNYARLRIILGEMRDLAAVHMQQKHFLNEN